MKKLVSTLIALLFSVSCLAGKPDEVNSVIAWLEVVDSGSYEKSWQQAAPAFQDRISSQEWVQALDEVRAPLGKVISRQVKSTKSYSAPLEGVDAEFVAIALTSSFERLELATESITVVKVGNEWRAVGYLIED